jgi:hypothetical protein
VRGNRLDFEGSKPNTCNSQKCITTFIDVGVGSNLLNDLIRDPIAADFFLSCYFTTEPNKALLTPFPPNYLIAHSRTLNSKLKPIFLLSYMDQIQKSKIYWVMGLSICSNEFCLQTELILLHSLII